MRTVAAPDQQRHAAEAEQQAEPAAHRSGWPCGPSVPRPAIQSAMLAFSSATSFDGRCCSA